MKAQLNSIISETFLTSFRTRILEINFSKYSIWSIYCQISLIFLLWSHLHNFPANSYCHFSAANVSPLHWSFTANRFYQPCFYFFLFHWLLLFNFDTKMASKGKDAVRLISSNLYICSLLAKPLKSVRVNDILTTVSIIVAA